VTTRPVAHGAGIAAVTAAIMLATLLPFLPGGHDTLAVPLSTMSQIVGIVGLVLVPVGAFWVAAGSSKRLAGKQYGFAIVALIASSIVWLGSSLGAIAAYNLLFEQPALHFGTREFVVYNPLDQQTVTSHRLDRLQLTPSELVLEHTRGHNEVHDAGDLHWKYFWFD
jgi:hypothetical protein